jgi:hypothetical protein
MATARPFAYNPGSLISGTTQVGDLAVGFPITGFTNSPQFWNGPDEDLGYVIAQAVSGNTQPTQVPEDAITLSSTYKGGDITLSNNNQTATQIFGYQQSVLGETIISGTNKVMFSVLCNLLEPSVLVDSHFVGVGTTSMNYQGNPYGGYPGNDTQSIGFNAIGQYYYNGSVVSSGLPTWTDGDTIDIAISHGQYWWIRVNGGDWNDNPSANPTTLTGGLTMNSLTNYYPVLCPAYQGIMTVLNYPKYGVPSDYNFLGNVTASVGFFRSSALTDESFIQLTNSVFNQSFTAATDASTWLTTNGYWNSYGVSLCDSFTFNDINANTTTTSAIKTSGGGWDASAYSVETYTTPVTLTFQTTANGNYLMGGFSYSPTGNTETYTNTTYGLYVQPNFLEIYENGSQATVPGAMVNLSTDVWKVEYNGTNVTYYKNDVLIYTSSNAVTQPLHVFFALLTQNEGVTDVCFTV